MFGENQFYPTPPALIHAMLAPYAELGRDFLWNKSILEPSAGKGNIVNALHNIYRVKKSRMMVIEIDADLQNTLIGAEYSLIHTDFLAYTGQEYVDFIIMNPPFREGAKHLLKAWDVVAGGGHIVCILNAETLNNPYSQERKTLQSIINEHGRVEFVTAAFVEAERSTDVDVVIVWLEKPQDKSDFAFDTSRLNIDTPEQDASYEASQLAQKSMIDSIVAQYNAALKAVRERYQANEKLKFYTKDIHGLDKFKSLSSDRLNDEISTLKARFWDYMFEKTQLGGLATRRVKEQIDRMRTISTSLAFDEHNVYEVMSALLVNRDDIMIQCIRDVFETATKYHKDNVIHHEGWVTNKAWKINNKVIVPNGVRFDPKYGGHWTTYGHGITQGLLEDLDKVLCFMTGHDYNALRVDDYGKEKIAGEMMNLSLRAIDYHLRSNADYDEWFESKWFKLRVFKKGTVHLVWKDKTLLDDFNRIAAENKAWLGNGK